MLLKCYERCGYLKKKLIATLKNFTELEKTDKNNMQNIIIKCKLHSFKEKIYLIKEKQLNKETSKSNHH